MANDVKKTRHNPGCEWARDRLPLLVGDLGIEADRNGEGGDLSPAERSRIERHLAGCAACRGRQSDLERAYEILTAAAADLPVESSARSLWPALERRIREVNRPVVSRATLRVRDWTHQWVRLWADFTTDLPLRRAWARDYFQTIFSGQENVDYVTSRRVGFALRVGVAAVLCVAVVAASSLWRQWERTQYIIKTNTSPLVDQPAPQVQIAQKPEVDSSPSDTGNAAQSDLVQADATARPSESAGASANGTREPKPAPPMRFGYDLERGIPMPFDARESKPSY
jgi:anti-sigma factor RsiW